MGVKGLQYYVEHHCPGACPTVSISDLAERHRITHNCVPVLVVDGMSLLHKLYAPNFDWICGGQWFEFVTFLNDVIQRFRAIGVKLVFFFDGTVCTSKRQEWSSRRVKRCKDISFIFSFVRRNGMKPDDKHFQLPTSMGTLTRFALKFCAEVEVYTTTREADQEISHYAKINPSVFAILSQDSDFMIYDTKLYLSVSHLDLSTLTTVLYDREKLATQLGLHVRQMPLFSCLVGNDIISNDILRQFHQWLCQNFNNYRPSIENVAPRVSQLINSCGWLGNEQNTQELIAISHKVFGTDRMYQLFQEALMTYSHEMEEIPATSVQMIPPEMGRLAYSKHVHCENAPPIYNILCNLEYESSEVMEDPADKSLPPSAFVYRPARKRMYTVLFGCTPAPDSSSVSLRPQRPQTAAPNITVKEWCAYEGNNLDHPEIIKPLPIHLPGGVPSLEVLWCGGPGVNNLRLSCFLACLGIPMTPTKLKSLDPKFATLCCILNYLLSYKSPLLAPWEVAAFIAQAVSPRAGNLTCLMQIKVPRLETRAMHLVSLFMHGVVTVITILGTCGYPFLLQHAMPWCYFDGKLFHQLYIQAKDGASIEDLCEHNEKALADFYHLLEAAIMGTPLSSKKMFQSL